MSILFYISNFGLLSFFHMKQILLNGKKGPSFPLAITLAAEEQSEPSEVKLMSI